jgi:hypothetical protein
MHRYFFDLRDDDGLVVDEEGLELKDLHIVQERSRKRSRHIRSILPSSRARPYGELIALPRAGSFLTEF